LRHCLMVSLVLAASGCVVAKCQADEGKSAGELCLAENGQSDYTIVIAADACPPVKFAAEELQKYLAMISGARLPLSNLPTADLAICVGEGGIPAGEVGKLRCDLKDRGEDGYVMCRLGKRLALTGNSPRATLYAVYHFLEKYLGCGWGVPGDDTVPRQTTIRIPEFHDAVGPPAFSMRQIILFPYGGTWMKTNNLPQVDWMAKNRFNWAHPAPNGPGLWEQNSSRTVLVPEVAKRGLLLEVGGHAFSTWLPPSRYAKDHPDYFAVKEDGTRATAEFVCLSHPDVAKVMADNIVKWLDENPEVAAVDLWHNDLSDFCHCVDCTPKETRGDKALAQAAYTRTYVHFVNQVAARVAQRHPKVLVNLLAYDQTVACPAGTASLEDNVLVGLCLFPRPTQRTMRPLETSPQPLDSRLRQQIPLWQNLSRHFYIYEYYTFSVREKIWPRAEVWSMVSMICDDIRFFRRSGVDGISSDQWSGDWAPLNMYAFSKLIWEPQRNPKDIVDEFCCLYYGDASGPMTAYWELLEEGLQESWRTNDAIDWRDEERRVQIRRALSQAESDTVKNRIRATASLHLLTISE
jgi:hypothetical protein